MSQYHGECYIDSSAVIIPECVLNEVRINANSVLGANVYASNVEVGLCTTIGESTQLNNCKIGNNCELAQRVTIGHGVSIDDSCRIGFGTTIDHGCEIADHVIIGDHVVIESGCVISPQAVIGDGSRIESGTTICRAAYVLEDALIGRGCRIDNEVTAGGRIVENYELYHDNIVIHGLEYLIADAGRDMISIGCQVHSLEKWKMVGPKMAQEAGVDFLLFKEAVELLIKLRDAKKKIIGE